MAGTKTFLVIKLIGASCRRFANAPATASTGSSPNPVMLGPWSTSVALPDVSTRRSGAGFSAEVLAPALRGIYAGLGFTLAGGALG